MKLIKKMIYYFSWYFLRLLRRLLWQLLLWFSLLRIYGYVFYLRSINALKKKTALKVAHFVIVTGAAGKIAINLRRFLLARGFKLYSIDCLPFKKIHRNETVFHIGIKHLSKIAPLFEDGSYVIHLAADPCVDASWKSVLCHNIDGTYHVFEMARKAKIQKVIFASSVHASQFDLQSTKWETNRYSSPVSLYGASKSLGESLAHVYAIRYNMKTFVIRIGAYNSNDSQEINIKITAHDLNQLIYQCFFLEDRFKVIYGISASFSH